MQLNFLYCLPNPTYPTLSFWSYVLKVLRRGHCPLQPLLLPERPLCWPTLRTQFTKFLWKNCWVPLKVSCALTFAMLPVWSNCYNFRSRALSLPSFALFLWLMFLLSGGSRGRCPQFPTAHHLFPWFSPAVNVAAGESLEKFWWAVGAANLGCHEQAEGNAINLLLA